MSDSSNEIRDSFGAIASVAHELRTPLTAVQGAVEILRDGAAGELSAAQREFVDLAHRNLERLKNRIEDALDIAELSAAVGHTGGPLPLPVVAEKIAVQAAIESGPALRITFTGFTGELDIAISRNALCRTLASLAATVARHSATCDVGVALSVVNQQARFEVSDRRLCDTSVQTVGIHGGSLTMAQEVISQRGGTLQVAERGRCGVYVVLPIQPIDQERKI